MTKTTTLWEPTDAYLLPGEGSKHFITFGYFLILQCNTGSFFLIAFLCFKNTNKNNKENKEN